MNKKSYAIGMFLQSSTYDENEIKFNDIKALYECLKIENIINLVRNRIQTKIDKRILQFLENDILNEMNTNHTGYKDLKVIINRVNKFIFKNKEVLMYLID